MKTAVVIPCYRVKNKIIDVLNNIPSTIEKIYVVDDACPEKSGQYVQENFKNSRIEVIFLSKNQGVGGATLAGFSAAHAAGYEIVVKIDGDGQMDPALIPQFIFPIANGQADFTKGNRFYSPRSLRGMPAMRLWGNAFLSFFSKITSGYWQMMDPTNGFIALHTNLLPWLDVNKLEKRYFFENDLLFRLGILRAVVVDIPMNSRYADEHSSLSIKNSLFTFPGKLAIRILKRFTYCYFIRDFNIASVFFVFGFLLCGFGFIFGGLQWIHSILTGEFTSSGTVMLAGLPVLLGVQFFLFALQYDVLMQPRLVIYPSLAALPKKA